jgi:hypothetical protein
MGSCGDRITYGLIECIYFEFPIVDGVLLLSLTKGYGGSEDILISYESFLAASITYIKADDLQGLQLWIEKNAPAVGQLMFQEDLSFTDFDVEYTREYNTNNAKFLDAQKTQYGVVGETLGDGVPINEHGGGGGRIFWLWSTSFQKRLETFNFQYFSYEVGNLFLCEASKFRTVLMHLLLRQAKCSPAG